MNGEDPEGHDLLVADMDAIAKELTKLKEKDIPVLWRPLHEASGGWFWWGNCSAESYIKLYREMYEKFTKEYELHNLIWVWNGQSKSWYPGDDVVDLMGDDIYPGKHKYSSQQSKFNNLKKTTDTKMIVAMTENGCLFDPDKAVEDDAMWSYFGTWGGEFVTDSDTLNVYSETYTEQDMLVKVYNHERVITRDELPDLKTYGDAEETGAGTEETASTE
jgi:mannan endo-1,4-beta-mannosidase